MDSDAFPRFTMTWSPMALSLVLSGLLVWPGTALSQPTFSAASDLVVLHVTVKDRQGRYVPRLARDAFTVSEDSHLQRVELFAHEDAPVTVGLLIDNSGSMHANRDRVLTAVTAFAQTSHPQDEVFALAFNDTVTAALPASDPFTSDPARLRDALAPVIGARGRTSLFDAIAAGLDYLNRGNHARKVLVVLSDGGDNASQTTFQHVLRKAQASNAVLYTVGLVDALERDSRPRQLRELARVSGGEAHEPRRVDQIAGVLRKVAEEIRHSYTLGFVSSNTARDGTFRRLHVTVATTPPRRLLVRTRGGYVAGRPGEPRDVSR